MPNAFAYLMLAAWPFVVAILFSRLSLERAFIWSILGGYLILPPLANIDPPILPPLDKHAIPALSVMFAIWFKTGRFPNLVPQSKLVRLSLAVMMISGIGTVLTNSDPVVFGVVFLPGMHLGETLLSVLTQFVMILPLLLAQDVIKTPAAMRELILSLVIAGLAYSLPMLLEVRLSPQLNTWIYGFFQASFQQMMRYGGFRPIVFLEHGLWVAFFAFMAFASSIALLRNEADHRPRYFAISLYLAAVLVLCKTAGALIYSVCFAPLMLFASRRTQILLVTILAAIVILYPALRGSGVVPTESILSEVESIDADRAQSLGFRMMNEDILLDRAMERPLFGWGGWARNQLHDPVNGRMTTVTDGLWVGVIGSSGWLGYVGYFGLLTLPLFLLTFSTRRRKDDIDPYVTALALMLGVNLVDIIPNATVVSITWVIAGTILGHVHWRETNLGKVPVAPVPSPKAVNAPSPAPWSARQRQKQKQESEQ